MKKITANKLEVGMNLIEADGGLLRIDSIEHNGKTVVATCSSMMSRGIVLKARGSKVLYVA